MDIIMLHFLLLVNQLISFLLLQGMSGQKAFQAQMKEFIKEAFTFLISLIRTIPLKQQFIKFQRLVLITIGLKVIHYLLVIIMEV